VLIGRDDPNKENIPERVTEAATTKETIRDGNSTLEDIVNSRQSTIKFTRARIPMKVTTTWYVVIRVLRRFARKYTLRPFLLYRKTVCH
jgi:hypothetical protein